MKPDVETLQVRPERDPETKLLILTELLRALMKDAGPRLQARDLSPNFAGYLEGKIDAFKFILEHLTENNK